MPPTAAAGVKKLGQADKDLLNNLINRQLINITDTSLSNIEQVRHALFHHRNTRNFRQNFQNFAAVWDLEIEYSGAQRRKSGGKLRRLFSAFFYHLFARHLTLCLLCQQGPLCLEKEVASKEDDADDNALDNGYGDEDMPPKAKPAAAAVAAVK